MPKKLELFLLGLIMVLALLLRLPLLNGSFWLDEAAQALESSRPLAQQHLIIDDFQPPLMHYLLHFALYISSSEAWLRFTGAVVPSLFTVLGVYILGKKLFTDKIALLAAFLTAISSLQIFFGQELRPYALALVFGIWSWIACLEMAAIGQDTYQVSLKSPLSHLLARLPLGKDFWVWLILNIAGIYSTYVYPIVFAAQIIFLLIIALKHRLRLVHKALLGGVFAIFAFLPWLKIFISQFSTGQALRTTLPGWENVVSFDGLKALALLFGKFIYGVSDLDFNFFFIANSLLLAILFIIVLFRVGDELWHTKRSQFFALFTAFFLPLVLVFAISFFVPLIQPKRLLFLQPLIFLFLSALAFQWPKKKKELRTAWWQQKINIFGMLILLDIALISVWSTFNYWTNINLQRENWRDLRTQIYDQFDPATTVIVTPTSAFLAPWNWYENRALASKAIPAAFPLLSLNTYYIDTNTPFTSLAYLSDNYDTVLTFDYLSDLSDPHHLLEQQLLEHGFTPAGVLDMPQIGFVRIYREDCPQEEGVETILCPV